MGEQLGTSYVDLCAFHFQLDHTKGVTRPTDLIRDPTPQVNHFSARVAILIQIYYMKRLSLIHVWKSMEELKREGLCPSIGLGDFKPWISR